MMKYDQSNTLVVRKTYRTLKDSCFTDLKWATKRLGVENLSGIQVFTFGSNLSSNWAEDSV